MPRQIALLFISWPSFSLKKEPQVAKHNWKQRNVEIPNEREKSKTFDHVRNLKRLGGLPIPFILPFMVIPSNPNGN